jgi:hypothetical protein
MSKCIRCRECERERDRYLFCLRRLYALIHHSTDSAGKILVAVQQAVYEALTEEDT